MNYCVLDVETTIKNRGHPFSTSNKLCAVGLKDQHGTTVYNIEHGEEPFGDALSAIRSRIESARYLVGFNIKFDLHWIRRYVPDIQFPHVFDCQLAQFLLHGQIDSYPSLDGTAASFHVDRKLDRVQREYWDLGLDTTVVPWGLLSDYCAHDVEITDQIHQKQRVLLRGPMRRLFHLQCQDLLILEEMEWNGLKYDFAKARTIGQELQQESEKIDDELRHLVGSPCVDLNSGDHLSSVLYGGIIHEPYRESYIRKLKHGKEKQVQRWSLRPVEFGRMVTPLRNTELKPTAGLSDEELGRINRTRVSEGRTPYSRKYSVAEPVLAKLRASKRAARIIELVLRKSRIRKLDSTYYSGLVEKAVQMEWSDGFIHGQLNQCVARTGRLSSSEPNEQNFDKEIKQLFGTRYAS